MAGQCSESGQSLYDVKFECDDIILSRKNQNKNSHHQGVHNGLEMGETDTIDYQNQNSESDQILSKKDEVMLRQKASNETAVIVSVSIVSTVVLLTIFMFIYLKWCKSHVNDWIKEYKWRRHDARLAQKRFGTSPGTAMVPNGTLAQGVPDQYQQYHPYLKGDNYIYTSPRLHHTYVYHGQSPLHQSAQQYYTQNTAATSTTVPHNTDNNTVIDNDDEYFYVSNHYSHQDTAVVMNNGGYATTTTAKHIPVTVL